MIKKIDSTYIYILNVFWMLTEKQKIEFCFEKSKNAKSHGAKVTTFGSWHLGGASRRGL
jgi:hypothetical protein